MRRFWPAAIVPLFFLLTGCLDQDQTIIKPEHIVIGNPAPTARNFTLINSRHKVLMAIFDSGIDYNHPELIKNVHFELNAQGNPISAGKDYLANDNWASWRLVDTNSYEFKYLGKEEQQNQLEQTTEEKYNEDLRRRIGERQCLINTVLKIEPRLGLYTNPYRATIDEEDVAYRHGTHVAGLMTYDRPDFGLIPYRILPYHQDRQDKIDANVGKGDKFVENFADAVADASKKGVRIINLSIGGAFTRPDDDSSVQDEANLEKFNNLSRIITGRMTEIIKAYPQILFVAAAGNDSGWSDNQSRIQYPCGVEAKNVLCVGAINSRNTMTTFTNIPLNNVDLVFAPGSQIKSLSPSDRCPFLNQMIDSFLTAKSGAALCSYKGPGQGWLVDENVEQAKETIIKAAYNACAYKGNQYVKFSGTSMATPIVSHFAAELLADHDYASAEELIAAIKAKAIVNKSKSFVSYFLTNQILKTPSWDDEKNAPAPTGTIRLTGNDNAHGAVTSMYQQVYQFLGLNLADYVGDPSQMPFQIIMGREVP